MQFSAPLKSNSKKIMLLGSGELGKEVIIEAQRLGLETIAVDTYDNAPAHHVAHRSYVINMQDKEALLEVIRREKPDYILPEIEAISIDALFAILRIYVAKAVLHFFIYVFDTSITKTKIWTSTEVTVQLIHIVALFTLSIKGTKIYLIF